MEFSKLNERAQEIRGLYSELENKKYGKNWTSSQIMEGFVVDVGELMEYVMAKQGIREVEDVDKKLAHELSDCLWSVLVLAREYDIDIEKEFLKTMDSLEGKIGKILN